MSYDKNAAYPITFVGGPSDGETLNLIPADRVTWNQTTEKGVFLKQHIYNLRETVNQDTGEIVKLEYIYQK